MSKSWPMVPLGEVLTQYQEYVESPEPRIYPKLSVKLYGKGVSLDAPADGTTLKMKRHQIAKAGQVILSEIWGKKGAIGFVPLDGDGALCTSHFFLFDVRHDKIDPKWLQAIFSANYLQEQLDAEAKGTTGYAAVRPKHLLAAKIPLPPLSEQKRIVAKVEELAAKIEDAYGLRRQAVEEASIFERNSASRVFEKLVESHPLHPLGELVTLKGGGTPSKANPFFWNGSIPWISPKDMKSRELHDAVDHISEDAIKNSAAKLIEPGAVLVVVRGMILVHTFPSAILRTTATINQDMKALIPCSALLPEFLSCMFWAYNSRILKLVEKSTHDTRRLDIAKLLDTKIGLPGLPEQRRIVAYIDDLQAKVDALKRLQAETRAELNAILPSMLDKALNNQL